MAKELPVELKNLIENAQKCRNSEVFQFLWDHTFSEYQYERILEALSLLTNLEKRIKIGK